MLFEKRDYKWVYHFSEGRAEMKSLLGGKGANMAEMVNAGLPVPPGFTITTEACNAYYDYSRQFPEGMWSQAQEALKQVESQTGKIFGDSARPLFVSVRSGSPVSMPGMMDTVLNLGLNDETVEGLAAITNNRRFALDAYRRLIMMFGHIVMGVSPDKFDRILERFKAQTDGGRDTDLSAEQLQDIIIACKRVIFAEHHGEEFPQNPYNQLRMAISAVFDSWMGKRAVDYRRVHHIPSNMGTAVNIQAMVFGNLGWDSGTGVAFTRNPSTGENVIYGEYLLNAQGEDVVAGIRTPQPLATLAKELPLAYAQLRDIATRLERHYQDMQDIEFTIEAGKLWILQTRRGARTGAAAARIAVEMVQQGLIDRQKAVKSVDAGLIDQLLHPMVDPQFSATVLASGLPASPGAGAGRAVFDPDEAETMAKAGEPVILVREETSPDDFHGMIVAEAILTARGGMTSHAAVVCRGMGKPCVVGVDAIDLHYGEKLFYVSGHEVRHGDWLTVDGSTGRVLLGKVPTIQPELGEHFQTLMQWADEFRTLRVRVNADNGHDATVARQLGAEGIGLCRTEHMFFAEDRLAIVREMILADSLASREQALEKLLPIQRSDFLEIFRAMDGLPVTIRLLDPPLHEFLPDFHQLHRELAEYKLQLQKAQNFGQIDQILKQIWSAEQLVRQVERLRETNPMLGHRGCRLGIIFPEVTKMQTQAIFEAACEAYAEGVAVIPEVMIPLVSTAAELKHQREVVIAVAEQVLGTYGLRFNYLVGTMIELPRAALTADSIAEHAEFFSFGTNDLTQTTFGLSRDDSGRFLPSYISAGILPRDPFQVLDREGVGQLIQCAIERGRGVKPSLKIGICGEHGGDPSSIEFCHEMGMDYVSCSPFRVPIARLAAAQASLQNATKTQV